MILPLLFAVQVAAGDSAPRITLREALERSARLDPNYVTALGGVDNAEWGRFAALTAFVVPNVTIAANGQRAYPGALFNSTPTNIRTFWNATLSAQIDLFTGGQKIAAWQRARAELDGAQANETRARFAAALLTESAYYDALAAEELTRAATRRRERAEEQMTVARSRVLSGAAVQTDTLQLFFQVVQARVALLRQERDLRAARLQLGRRIGMSGPAQPVAVDTVIAPELPFSLDDAVRRAVDQGPDYRAARANERAASAAFRGQWGTYLPRVTLSYTGVRADTMFYPNAIVVGQFNLGISLPIWNGAQREIALSRARVSRDVARAIRDDLERASRRDVGTAYDNYEIARAEFTLREAALAAARENFRVQDTRYRSGATTILDLVDAQLSLAEAEADMARARYATRTALAAIEAILGQRLFSQDTQ